MVSAAIGSHRPNSGSPPPGPGPIDPAPIPTEIDGEGDPIQTGSVGVVAVAAALGSLRDVEPVVGPRLGAATALSDGACATVGARVGAVERFGVGVGAGRGFGVGVGVGLGVGVGRGFCVGVGAGVGVGVGVGEAIGVGFGVGTDVGDGCVVGAGVGLGWGGGGGIGVGGGREGGGEGVTCGFLAGTNKPRLFALIAAAELGELTARDRLVCAVIGWAPDARDSMTRPANSTA